MYPLKQGLKHQVITTWIDVDSGSLPMYPLKQGLKHHIDAVKSRGIPGLYPCIH